MPAPIQPDEFVRRAAEAGLNISKDHVSEMEVPGYSPAAAYETIRSIDYTAEEPAATFRPLRRGGKRS